MSSTTDTFEDGVHYSNGFVYKLWPADGASEWQNCAYITPLSDNPVSKIEYLFMPTSFEVISTTPFKHEQKLYWQIDLKEIISQ